VKRVDGVFPRFELALQKRDLEFEVGEPGFRFAG
jgi:hypothetical protein